MAFQAIYFGDILPDNYDKVKQIWLKTGKGDANNESPNEFHFDFGNYKTKNSIEKEILRLKKRERKEYLKILEEDQCTLYDKLFKKLNSDVKESKKKLVSTNSIVGYNWYRFSDNIKNIKDYFLGVSEIKYENCQMN